jgi:hypothetical protein
MVLNQQVNSYIKVIALYKQWRIFPVLQFALLYIYDDGGQIL